VKNLHIGCFNLKHSPKTSSAQVPGSETSKQLSLKESILKGASKKYALDGEKQEEIDKAISEMLAVEMTPLFAVQKIGFRHLMNKLQPLYTVRSPYFYRKEIMMLYLEQKKELKELLYKELELGCATTDIWSSTAAKGFMVVEVHFINQEWCLVTKVLELRRFKGQASQPAARFS